MEPQVTVYIFPTSVAQALRLETEYLKARLAERDREAVELSAELAAVTATRTGDVHREERATAELDDAAARRWWVRDHVPSGLQRRETGGLDHRANS